MKNRIKVLIALLAAFIIIAGVTSYYLTRENKNVGSSGGGKTLVNPAAGLTLEEAVAKFDESFVYYLLYSIGTNKLHSPHFSSSTPQIKFYIDNDVYNAEIVDGQIKVRRGEIDGGDIIIRTTTEEAVKMVMDKNYVAESFKSGISSIELVAGKLELASKGYLQIYDELSGDD